MPFLVIDVGGDDLTVEVNTSGARWQQDTSGVDEWRAASGALNATETFAPRDEWPFTSGPLTTSELAALRAAAKWPQTIQVEGEFDRTGAPGSGVTINATVRVTEGEFLAVGEDHIHLANIVVRAAD